MAQFTIEADIVLFACAVLVILQPSATVTRISAANACAAC